ncbi:DUF1801 domain-containing protein [Lysobacter yangpyeongensis]|uniref:DUF1801 domain-containing protein n=1 Tax=Lysobacter yangpyeongensis TaxID=346182 RepID=A0ABW0SN21_9GAMM
MPAQTSRTPATAPKRTAAKKVAAKPHSAMQITGEKAATKKRAAKQRATIQAQGRKGATKRPAPTTAAKQQAPAEATKPRLLAGGNPQIAKGEGEAPVQAYLAAMPGWKRDIGRRLDDLITRAVPGVRKAVKWNSPFYGVAERGWFLSYHCYDRYVKVAFFRGASLHPQPPGASKQDDVRYLDIREDDAIDEAQFVAWVAQASALPGWMAK